MVGVAAGAAAAAAINHTATVPAAARHLHNRAMATRIEQRIIRLIIDEVICRKLINRRAPVSLFLFIYFSISALIVYLRYCGNTLFRAKFQLGQCRDKRLTVRLHVN